MIIAEIDHLNKLCYYLAVIQDNPSICQPDVRPAAIDWLNGRIAELEQDFLGSKEKAAGQGDSFSKHFEINVDFSIPSSTQVDKEVVVHV